MLENIEKKSICELLELGTTGKNLSDEEVKQVVDEIDSRYPFDIIRADILKLNERMSKMEQQFENDKEIIKRLDKIFLLMRRKWGFSEDCKIAVPGDK